MKDPAHRPLTPAMRAALRRARDQGLPTECPNVHRRTLKTLERNGLLHRRRNRKGRELWRPTPAGLRALVRPAAPCFLALRSQYGYTHRFDKALHCEPEPLREVFEERERQAWLRMAA